MAVYKLGIPSLQSVATGVVTPNVAAARFAVATGCIPFATYCTHPNKPCPAENANRPGVNKAM